MSDYKFVFNPHIETFAMIEGYEKYQVSNYGNVYNVVKKTMLYQNTNKDGYKIVFIQDTQRQYFRQFRIHRLVAEAFLNNPLDKSTVDHIDGDRTNNHIDNLRFSTRQENCWNTKKRNNTSSQYKGVSFSKQKNKRNFIMGV
jgi:hypothetical protein